MTTITIKVNERTKKGKAFLEFARTFFQEGKEVTLVENNEKKKSPYNPEFVAKIKEAEEDVKKGRTTRLNPKNIWESIL